MQKRWVFFSGAALLAGALIGNMFSPAPVGAVAKEIIQLQRDVALLLQAQRDLQRSVDEKHAVLKTLLEQQLDSTNRLSQNMVGLQKTVQDVQANTGARMDSMSTQVQALADNFEELKVRMGRLAQQVSDTQSVLQNLDARLAGGAPVPVTDGSAPPAGGPPPSADVLYSNALRDFTGGKYDLARQEFEEYLKYFPDNDLASNCRFYLGEINFRQGKYREAIADYDAVLDRYPRSFKHADARLKKAMALLEMGQRASALRELREVRRRHPGTEAAKQAEAKLRELSTAPGE